MRCFIGLLFAFLTVQAYAQGGDGPYPGDDPGWNWAESPDTRCFAPADGPPTNGCKDLWESDGIPSYLARGICSGLCDIGGPNTQTITCTLQRLMSYASRGPGIDDETPAMRVAKSLPNDTSWGNRVRFRPVKCVEAGKCECFRDVVQNRFECRADVGSKVYYWFDSYQADLLGTACAEPNQGGGGGGPGSDGSGSGGSGSDGSGSDGSGDDGSGDDGSGDDGSDGDGYGDDDSGGDDGYGDGE